MLQGRGGNIALLGGPDGVVMVDDQFAALSKRLLEASRSIFKEDIRFVINTHHHGDHTGGNEFFGAIAAIKLILSQVGASTKIIPGHGALSNRDELQEYLFMLETIRNRALIHIDSKSKDPSEPSLTRGFDTKWDGGFISSKRFQEIVLRSLRNRHDKMF